MIFNSSFYLSLITVMGGLFGGIIFLVLWLRNRERPFSLFVSLGMFLPSLFEAPFILANWGIQLAVTDYNLFYAITIPLAFAGTVLLYVGLWFIAQKPDFKTLMYATAAWVFVCVLAANYVFLARGGIMTNHFFHLASILLFLLPIHLLLLKLALQLIREKVAFESDSALGFTVIAVSFVFMIAGDVISIPHTLSYPPWLWFIAASTFDELFLLKITNTIILLVGFLLIHKNYRRVSSGS